MIWSPIYLLRLMWLNTWRRALVCALGTIGAATSSARAAELNHVQYNRDVLPILAEACFRCHGPDSATREAGLRLDQGKCATSELASGATAIVPGAADKSEVAARIATNDETLLMPPPESGKSLTAAQRKLLVRWIDEGAAYEPHWAYIPPQRPNVPKVRGNRQPTNPVDAFIRARLETSGMQPSNPATLEQQLRRASFALTGLPPTLEDLDAVAHARDGRGYTEAVERLLSSVHYGERMAQLWLDGARFADSNGYQNDFARNMSPWRDWVIKAFNERMPFDQFLMEQIAGDLMPDAKLSQKIATGFNRNHRTVTEFGSIDAEWHVENVVDRTETFGTVVLGLTIGCARCHDHKFDPISQREFYQIYAFFNNVDELGVYTEQRGNVPPLVSLPSPSQEADLSRLDRQIGFLSAEEKEGAEKSSRKNELDAMLQRRAALVAAIPTSMVLAERAAPRDTFLLMRGHYASPEVTEKLLPRIPDALGALPIDAPRNRLGLARWVVKADNPLTARVMVNSLWQQCFNRGLVDTPENFGVQCRPPLQKDLLDWLAVEFIECDWDVQHILRLIVSSDTFRQSAEAPMGDYVIDPDNEWLARGPRGRLPAEAVRDNALAISGLISDRVGGPSVKPYQPLGLWEELAGKGHESYVQSEGKDLHRRSLYTFRKRTVPHPTMSTFDAPSWEFCQVRRSTTNTPLQALALLNDFTFVEAARAFAQRVIRQQPGDDLARVKLAFRLATSRRPTEEEETWLLEALGKYRAHFLTHPVAAAEFVVHGVAAEETSTTEVELAAHVALARVLLNLDEAISIN